MNDASTLSTGELVERSRARDDDLAAREEMFARLVERYQDAAFACAHAQLGDPWLAEDAAQEAFLEAWLHLDDLREPEAFPGWLRRLVLTQCHRMRRAARLRLVPMDAASLDAAPLDAGDARAHAAGMGSPEALAAAHERTQELDDLIASLPPAQRLVLVLADVYEFSQPDIAAFLALPLSTITRRLFHARRRLKARAGSTLGSAGSGLRGHRPSRLLRLSRHERFAVGLSSRMRPLQAADWSQVDALLGERAADRHRQIEAHRSSSRGPRRRREYVIDVGEDRRDDRPIVACGAIQQSIFDPIYRLSLTTGPAWLERGAGDLLLARLMSDLKEAGAIAVEYHALAHERAVVRFLQSRGFVDVARSDDRLVLERLLRRVEPLEPAALDAYAGVYAPDAATLQRLPVTDPFTIHVERHGSWLVSKARGMCDRLYPESASAFFVRHHYGHLRFLRDALGRVSHLLYTEGPHQGTAAKIS